MSIEFFRTECQRPLDADGYEIDSATREIAEINAWFAAQTEQADVAWLNENPALPPICGGSPADDDPDGYTEWSRRLDELYLACEYHDRLEAMHYIDGDQAAADAGLAVG